MVTIKNLTELNENDLMDIINKLSLNELKSLLGKAINQLKKNDKSLQYKNRLVKDKFDTTSESIMPPKSNGELNYEGKSNKATAKRGRTKGDKNTYSEFARRILAGEGKDGYLDGIPYEEVIIESDDNCPICGEDLKVIGEDAMVKVVFVPSSYKLVVYRKKKKVCKNCGELFVPTINDPLSQSNVSASVACNFIQNKYQNGVPTYRMLYDFETHGIEISYNQIMNQIMKVSEKLIPLAVEIKKSLFLDNHTLFIDETTYKLVEKTYKSDNKIRKVNYIYGLVGEKAIYYEFTGERSADWLVDLFDMYSFKGNVNTDDFPGYNFLDDLEDVNHQLCLAHARRGMFYAYIGAPEEIRDTESCQARKGLLLYYNIFELERKIKGKTPDEIVKFRNSDIYLARINELKEFAEGLHPMKGSYLDDAVSYLLSNWDHLWTYLKDGSIPVTNVTAELSMKKIAQMRKNSLFFKNTETAKLNYYLMTIVQSAVKNHLDVYRYLNYCLHHITTSDVKALLPWNDNLYSLGENYDI